MDEKDKRKAISLRFKSEESDEFFQWMNNQSNLTVSLKNLIYHAIDLYGMEDFINHNIQKEVMRNSFILEAIKEEQDKPINPYISNLSEGSVETMPLSEDIKEIAGIKEPKEPAKNIYQNVNPHNL